MRANCRSSPVISGKTVTAQRSSPPHTACSLTAWRTLLLITRVRSSPVPSRLHRQRTTSPRRTSRRCNARGCEVRGTPRIHITLPSPPRPAECSGNRTAGLLKRAPPETVNDLQHRAGQNEIEERKRSGVCMRCPSSLDSVALPRPRSSWFPRNHRDLARPRFLRSNGPGSIARAVTCARPAPSL